MNQNHSQSAHLITYTEGLKHYTFAITELDDVSYECTATCTASFHRTIFALFCFIPNRILTQQAAYPPYPLSLSLSLHFSLTHALFIPGIAAMWVKYSIWVVKYDSQTFEGLQIDIGSREKQKEREILQKWVEINKER